MMSIILVKGVKKVKRAMRTDLFFKEKKFLFFLFCVRMLFLKAFFKKQIILILFCVKMQNVFFFVIIYS